MKKLLVPLCALAVSPVAFAQQPKAGTVSIIPRVGVSLANLPGDEILTGDAEMPYSPRYKAGFMGGVDVDYQFLPNLSGSIGVYYVQQGCRYDNGTTEIDGQQSQYVGYSNWSTQLHYLNVPLLFNAYIGTGFAIKAGVQMGFALSGKMKYTEMEYTRTDEDVVYGKPVDREVSLNKMLSSVTLAIPVGVSYEFSNVIIDARYNIGLTGYGDIYGFKTSKNSVFCFSAAYRFAL